MNTNRFKNCAILLVIALAFLLPSAVFAQYSQLVMSGAYSPTLYPDYDYVEYPILLGVVSGDFTTIDASLDANYDETVYTREDNSVGKEGGFKNVRKLAFDAGYGMGFFKPTKKKDGTNLFNFDVKGSIYRSLTTWQYYDNPSQYDEQDTLNWPLSLNLVYSRSFINKLDMQGIRFENNFEFKPHYFTRLAETDVSPVRLTYTSLDNDADLFSDVASAKYDRRFQFGRGYILLAGSYAFGYKNQDLRYITVDTDGDNLKDEIMTYEKWANDSNKYAKTLYGDFDSLISYKDRDWTFAHKIQLDSLLYLSLGGNMNLMFDVEYTPFDYSKRSSFSRMSYKDTSSVENTDTISFESERWMSDFGTGSVTAILLLRGESGKENLRFGLGYGRIGNTLFRDGKNRDGSNVYSSQNPGHFPEKALGEDFEAGVLTNSTTGVSPSANVTHAAHFEAGFDWIPAKNVTFVTNFGINFARKTTYYRVFNTDTYSVWQETSGTNELILNINPSVGLTLPLDKSGNVLISATIDKHSSGNTSWNSTFQTPPYDLTKDRESELGTIDTIANNILDVSYSWRVIIKK